MSLGILTSSLSLLLGFFPPSDLTKNQISIFHFIMSFGLFFSISLPILILILSKKFENSTLAYARVSRETSIDVTRETRPSGSVKK